VIIEIQNMPGMLKCNSSKGQIKLKADWHAIDYPKKQNNEFGFSLLF
jgi:hypothetical protein